MSASSGSYYLPNPSPWPIITSAGLFVLALGTVLFLNNLGAGPWLMLAGAAIIIYMMFRWFGQVIGESESGAYNAQVDLSFRWACPGSSSPRSCSSPLSSAHCSMRARSRCLCSAPMSCCGLGFDVCGRPAARKGNPFTPMGAWGIPAINTLILLTSGGNRDLATGAC